MPPGTLSDTSKSLSALLRCRRPLSGSQPCPCSLVLCQTQANHCQHFMCIPPGTLSDANKSLSALYVYAPRYPVRHKQITVSTSCPCPLVLCQTPTYNPLPTFTIMSAHVEQEDRHSSADLRQVNDVMQLERWFLQGSSQFCGGCQLQCCFAMNASAHSTVQGRHSTMTQFTNTMT